MHSTKCPHCGLVNFASSETCKRCNKDISDVVDVVGSSLPAPTVRESSVRVASDHPVIAWALTVLFATSLIGTSWARSLHNGSNTAYAFGAMCGSLIAWPAVLLIVYGLSRKFRERNSFHAVINYGLAMNLVATTMMVTTYTYK